MNGIQLLDKTQIASYEAKEAKEKLGPRNPGPTQERHNGHSRAAVEEAPGNVVLMQKPGEHAVRPKASRQASWE